MSDIDTAGVIAKVVREQLLARIAAETVPLSRSRIIRAEANIPDIDPLEWLNAQRDLPKVFWSDREHAFATAGIGVAAEHSGHGKEVDFDRLFREIKAGLSYMYSGVRYFGGMRFDPCVDPDPRWRPFGTWRFVVPVVEVGRKGNESYVACNIHVQSGQAPADHGGALTEFFDGLSFNTPRIHNPLPQVLSRHDRPSPAEWDASVHDLVQTFREGRAQKTVLARESFYEFDEPINAVDVLAALTKSTGFSFHFLFQLDGTRAFFGASPERLYKRQNTFLQSEALAGTRKRGETPEEDDALGGDLLKNEKERREHRYVVDHIRDVLDGVCRAVRGGDSVELLILRHCQHLLSRMEGMLTSSECDNHLLARLHPTPAVGGVPTAASLALIHALEVFDRGWYAGPVGWVGYDATEFAVAIRSGLAVGNTLSLYSGAGIVLGSTPEAEWEEIENKMRNFLNVLEHDGAFAIPPGGR